MNALNEEQMRFYLEKIKKISDPECAIMCIGVLYRLSASADRQRLGDAFLEAMMLTGHFPPQSLLPVSERKTAQGQEIRALSDTDKLFLEAPALLVKQSLGQLDESEQARLERIAEILNVKL